MTENFFDETRDQSIVKSTIVDKYFQAWFNVIKGHAKKVAYIDLFAGQGRYNNGAMSTPLRILTRAIASDELRTKLVTVFNDKDESTVRTLETEIATLPGIQSLSFAPTIWNEEVGNNIVNKFEKVRLIPTLFFVDPWGYKGLSLRLVQSVLKDWGCDCIFFFNYNRVSMGISNPLVKEHMEALFGEKRAEELARQVEGLSPELREETIVEALSQSFNDYGKRYVLPFRFKNETGTRTSHHLILVTKHPLGYTIMKDIMAAESTTADQGVPSFEYNPGLLGQGLLFELSRPLDDLEGMLISEFKRKPGLTVEAIFNMHHIGRRFVKSNYKDILNRMEAAGKVTMSKPAASRPIRNGKRTLADNVRVYFA